MNINVIILLIVLFANGDENTCGDGSRDLFYEECDNVPYCSNSCKCKEGYTFDEDQNKCNPNCDVSGCLSDCVATQECSKCDTSKGYREDCHGCIPGYFLQGYLKCVKFTEEINSTLRTCRNVIDATDLTYARKLTLSDDEAKTITLPKNESVLTAENCFERVATTTPYTTGFWIEINVETEGYVSIETTRHYSYYVIEYYHLQQKYIGQDTKIVILNTCRDDLEGNRNEECEFETNDVDQYIRSSRAVTHVKPGIPKYVFITKPLGALFQQDEVVLFSHQKQTCGSFFEEVLWNDIMNGSYVNKFKRDNMISSTDVCTPKLGYGKWFLIRGVEQAVTISTCDTQSGVESGFRVIEVESTKINSSLSCGNDNPTAKCVLVGSKSCGNGDTFNSKAVVSLRPAKNYFVFVTTTNEEQVEITITVKAVCPMGCGENGICSSSSGGCICINGYIRKGEVCTLCGNNQVDDGEDCDISDQKDDAKCDIDTCMCHYGYSPKQINGTIKCSLSTCGNGKVEEGEECDGGEGCDHCLCMEGYTSYDTPRTSCLSLKCGNKKLDEGEECDGGDGCFECECQEGYFTDNKVSCIPYEMSVFIKSEAGSGVTTYVLFWLFLLIIVLIRHKFLNDEIKAEWKAQNDLPFLESTIIPFNKTNSQYIDIKTNTTFFEFDNNTIAFPEIGNRPEVDEPVQATLELTNNYKEVLYFTFHCGEYTKYDIMFSPVVGTIKPKESATITVNLLVKCTTMLKERIPVTLRYGQLKSVLKEIEKNNPEIFQLNSSQNSDMSDDSIRIKADNMSNPSSERPHSSSKKGSGSAHSDSNKSDSKKHKEDKLKDVRKFHVYLALQVESALSTKLDYEEINLYHPPIGSGTFGIVYRADWRRVDVAVKVLKTDLVDLNDLLPNFMQEAEMMERIRCQYVVNFIGSVVTSDTLCLVTEFCPLGSLRKYMKTNALSEFLKLRFCQDIARGMEYLHENDIVHRDLKTDNVLVYSNNPFDSVTIKVTDFGTSRSFIESSGKIALQNIGTPMYMAPEIFQSEQMTLKSDVFSFAVCMLEVWLGKEPYDTMKFPDSESILKFVCSGKRLSIPEECSLKPIITKCWMPKPVDRPTFKEAGNLILPLVVQITSNEQKKVSTKTGSGSHSKEKTTNTPSKTISSLLSSSEVSKEHKSKATEEDDSDSVSLDVEQN